MGKIEGLVNAPAPRVKQKFKITVHYSSDRNKVMGWVLALDPEAEFKTMGSWDFKVKTVLTSSDLYRLLVKSEAISKIRKSWFF